MPDVDEGYELPEMPVPDDRVGNALILVLFWALVVGSAFPAWSIGWPWGWFVYIGTLLVLMIMVELRWLTNILVRTLPALRLLLVEARRASPRRGREG